MQPITFTNKSTLITWLIGIFIFVFNPTYAQTPDVRIYTLNCGALDLQDGESFFEKGFYPHKPLHLADPCFLIKNPRGWLLWDLGLGDQYVNHTTENKQFKVTLTVPLSLTAQLKQLGLTPNDIKFVALSHAHFDHTGNANLFPKATWLIQRAEYNFIEQSPTPAVVQSNLPAILKDAHKILLNGDHDVFGDGTVTILSTPGHTPGHQSLEVKLPHQGIVILSGDLYHTRNSYVFNQVPQFNVSRPDTLASRKRVNDILLGNRSQLIIQHDPKDFASLPKIPDYLN